ncbi:hypothetical protein KEM55_000740 [Ascosphaera atra]|nr:hypothetical protein KEM55_000740 [Ascosphaera atra]
MDEFEDMKKKVQGICAANTNDQDGTSPDEYSLIYSGTDSVRMSPSIWIEWFLYQAGPRARAMLNNYCRSSPRACHLDHFNSSDSRSSTEVNSSLMLQEIWDGMRLNAMNAEPVAGIEVGVFVIQRSHCTQHAASAA